MRPHHRAVALPGGRAAPAAAGAGADGKGPPAAVATPQPPARGAPARPAIGRLELELWRELIEERCGTRFPDSRERFLTRCLWQRMRELGVGGYGEYHRRVLYGPDGEGEWQRLLELLLNRETCFFRHPASYRALGRVLGELAARRATEGRTALALWSAGCSGGHEAYSLAMVALAALDPARWRVRVLGSDLSAEALAEARGGRYRAERTTAVPAELRHRFLVREETPAGGVYRVSRELRAAVELGRLNLAHPAGWEVEAQDVIFCQNVLIYFRPARRQEVVRELARRLKPGGYLFPAPGEVVGLDLPGLTGVGLESTLAYQRTV